MIRLWCTQLLHCSNAQINIFDIKNAPIFLAYKGRTHK